MIVLEKYRVHWEHTVAGTPLLNKKGGPILTRKGQPKFKRRATTQCVITNVTLSKLSSSQSYEHINGVLNKKKGILESFKKAVSVCPSKDLRDAFWTAFWEMRKPTVTLASDTVELLACADYVNYEVKKAIIRDDSAKSHVDWQGVGKKDILQYLAGRLQSYRTGSDYALLAIIKWAIIGFTNYKRAKDARIQNQSN